MGNLLRIILKVFWWLDRNSEVGCQRWWLENHGARIAKSKILKTCRAWWKAPGSNGNSWIFWPWRWRLHCCCCAAATARCDRLCLCSVVRRSWARHMGPSRLRRWQCCSPGSAQEHPTDTFHALCFCSNLGRWERGDVGHAWLWWWQYCSSRQTAESSTDSFHWAFICCDLGR